MWTAKTRLRLQLETRISLATELGHACHILAKNLSTFCPYSETLQETEINGGRLPELSEEISGQLNIQAGTWLRLAAFSWTSSENLKQKAEQKNLKHLTFGPKRIICKVGVKGNVVAEEISIIKRKPNILYSDRDKEASEGSKIAHPLEAQECKSTNISFEKSC